MLFVHIELKSKMQDSILRLILDKRNLNSQFTAAFEHTSKLSAFSHPNWMHKLLGSCIHLKLKNIIFNVVEQKAIII